MKIYVNGELQQSISCTTDLKNLIEDLQIECKKTKKILEIIVNEKSVESLPNILVDNNIEKVELIVKSALELIIESMMEGVDYLPKLQANLYQSAMMFQQANIGKGIEIFQNCIDGLIWLNQLLKNIQIYLIKDLKLSHKEMDFNSKIEDFNQILNELLIAWENEDYTLISDLIEYELTSILTDWQNNFVRILDELAEVK